MPQISVPSPVRKQLEALKAALAEQRKFRRRQWRQHVRRQSAKKRTQ